MTSFSEYTVYVDESGDHSLTSINSRFPVFALSFCVFKKSDYVQKIVPEIQDFKFRFWGHDSVILHEHEIRKSKGPFTLLLTDPKVRADFYDGLNQIITDAPFDVIAAVVLKEPLVKKYSQPWSPYKIALHFCLERLLGFLNTYSKLGSRVHVVFEGRGKDEDAELELEFRRIISGSSKWGWVSRNFSGFEFEPIFAKKAANSTGLQFADLTARPVGLKALKPKQKNRAYDVIKEKLFDEKHFP